MPCPVTFALSASALGGTDGVIGPQILFLNKFNFSRDVHGTLALQRSGGALRVGLAGGGRSQLAEFQRSGTSQSVLGVLQ